MANVGANWQHAARATYSYHLLSAQQEPYKKACLLTKNVGAFAV